MMEAAITQILLGDAAMVLQFGNEIYWGRRPQSATGSKYLTMQVISWPDSYVSSGADRLSAARVQFDVWGASYLSVRNGANALCNVLSGCRRTVAGVKIHAGFIDARRDFNEISPGDDSALFRRSTDIIIWHTA
ncbi:hypothetical protein [Martelella soudanensis]|uniref:hypothetical protein n=1 Tax=Martelella sp. NC20 TaxID=2740298 RepID=UPI0015DEBA35|nr:hypothetical protein [Martelella sp. NC20]